MEDTRLSVDMGTEEGFVRLDTFVEALREFRDMLSVLGARTNDPPIWTVVDLSVKSAHATVEAIGNVSAGLATSDAVIRGFVALEQGEQPPEEFMPALGHARVMAEMATKAGMTLAISGNNIVQSITKKTLETAKRFSEVGDLETAWGSAEGTIEMVSLRRGIQCNLYDHLTDRKIECRLDEGMFEDIRAALGRRVVATGNLKHDVFGQIRSIRVKHLTVLSDEEELPSIDQMVGIAPGITGGFSTEEYMRRLRDER